MSRGESENCHSDPAFGGGRISPPKHYKTEILHSAEFTLRQPRPFASLRVTGAEGLRSE